MACATAAAMLTRSILCGVLRGSDGGGSISTCGGDSGGGAGKLFRGARSARRVGQRRAALQSREALAQAKEQVAGGADDEAEILIELKNVKKSFGKKKVLDGASFKIRRGEAVGIIGSSGTGKSTILRIMAGLLAPDEGEVWIRGKPREGLLSDEKNPTLKVGMVFQSAALFDSLTIGENVGFKLYEHSDLPDDEICARVRESLSQVGLIGVEDKYPAQLSGGMKKRAALARAIIKEDYSATKDSEDALEEVVMYDEPTAGLDPVASTVVEDLMRNLHTGTGTPSGGRDDPGGVPSYIVVTHQHSTIRRAVDRLIFLHAGRVVWEGTSQEFDSTNEPIVRQFATGSLKGPIVY
mmetsp:Transcript_42732/g.68736  ORF Transcript_42732/g.68736 Transcript_42732/m.68736 type:complete len:353 (-) Transcript_42732:359-1417(-)